MSPRECFAHGRPPARNEQEDTICYGELWQCAGCLKYVCAGYGAADDDPNLCDDCYTYAHTPPPPK